MTLILIKLNKTFLKSHWNPIKPNVPHKSRKVKPKCLDWPQVGHNRSKTPPSPCNVMGDETN